MNQTETREALINHFNEVLNICKNDQYLYDSILNTRAKQIIFKGKDEIVIPNGNYQNAAKIILSPKRSIQAAYDYQIGSKTAVVNFANAFHPGGGVTLGALAQEESICRVTTLYPCLISPDLADFYETHHKKKKEGTWGLFGSSDIIYSPDCVIIGKDMMIPEILTTPEYKTVDIITCAAPDLRETITAIYNPRNLVKVLDYRINQIYRAAMNRGVDNLVLGAFGCGVFGCPTDVVAYLCYKYANLYSHHFKNIEFAVYATEENHENYDIFMEVAKMIKK